MSVDAARAESAGRNSRPRSGGSVVHQQAIAVLGLFTGFSLTALVLILSSPRYFQVPFGSLSGVAYFQLLATYVALVGCVCSVGALTMVEVAGGLSELYSVLDQLATTLYVLSVVAFVLILPLILVPFTQAGAAVVFAAEVILMLLYLVARQRPLSPRAIQLREERRALERPGP
jgi:hypothetical protein